MLPRCRFAPRTDIGHTPLLSKETVSKYTAKMWRRILHGLAIVAAVVSLHGSAPGLASPVPSAASWCPHHQQISHYSQSHHSDPSRPALPCCSSAMPGAFLPQTTLEKLMPLGAAGLIFWEKAFFLSGISIPPEMTPPRPSA